MTCLGSRLASALAISCFHCLDSALAWPYIVLPRPTPFLLCIASLGLRLASTNDLLCHALALAMACLALPLLGFYLPYLSSVEAMPSSSVTMPCLTSEIGALHCLA